MFEVCCRLCLEQTHINKMYSLYSKHKLYTIRDKIYQLFQIEFSDTEKLSAVCVQCLERIDVVDDIRNLFIESDKKLRSILYSDSNEAVNCTKITLPPSKNKEVACFKNEEYDTVDCETGALQQTSISDLVDNQCVAQSSNSKDSDIEENSVLEILDDEPEYLSDTEVSVYDEELVPEEIISEEELNEINNAQYVVIYTSEQSSDTVLENTETKIATDCTYGLLEVNNQTSLTNDECDQNNIRFSCNVCNEVFVNRMLLATHTKTVHLTEYPDDCKQCLMVFKSNCDLKTHDCNEKSCIKCPECTQNFQNLKTLHLHIRNAHTKRTYSNLCQSRKVILYKCDFCTEILPTSLKLIEHGKLLHPNEFILHSCNRCDQCFGNKQSFRSHLLAHDKNYECRHCGKLCPTAVSLAGHENTHTRDQPFQCSQCDRNFAQYTSMRRHMKIHFNEKAYQCDFCPKRFRQRSVMLTHRRIHTGEKPFNCEVCSKSFRDHSTLAKHKKIHTKANQNKKS
ncbi:zinc finger protein 883-like [Sabethes cyaneus]|uniref:zinc finger protein 883-like n=1 Tax=Sabethes cyaneus TaxID=53552 RepID=UPI00237E5B97|nr:zinc finger protein 883-like [Sabethes cyaneus]